MDDAMTCSEHAGALMTLRREAGMSQVELADAIGISQEMVVQMERGNAVIEKRTELAIKWVTSQPRAATRTRALIAHEVADLLDGAAEPGACHDDRLQRLTRLEDEWEVSGGPSAACALFVLTQGALKASRATAPANAGQAPHQANILRLEKLWRALANASAC
jgi:DNA-binding XRE family transcriptional regulator